MDFGPDWWFLSDPFTSYLTVLLIYSFLLTFTTFTFNTFHSSFDQQRFLNSNQIHFSILLSTIHLLKLFHTIVHYSSFSHNQRGSPTRWCLSTHFNLSNFSYKISNYCLTLCHRSSNELWRWNMTSQISQFQLTVRKLILPCHSKYKPGIDNILYLHCS